MISRTVKIVSAAAIAAALIGTVAVSRTVHTRLAAAVQPAHDSATAAAPGATTWLVLNGYIACGRLSYSDCEKLETLLPQ